MATEKAYKDKSLEEMIDIVVAFVNEEFLRNNYKGESLFIRMDKQGYLIGCMGKVFYDTKKNEIPTYEITHTELGTTRAKTLEKAKAKIAAEREWQRNILMRNAGRLNNNEG
jgi:hypothetical protein